MSGENPYQSPTESPAIEKKKADPLAGFHFAAEALFLVSILELAASGFFLLIYVIKCLEDASRNPEFDPRIGVAIAFVACVRGVMVQSGALCARAHQKYSLALTGAILGLVGVLSTPFALWLLIAFRRKETRAAFKDVK